MATTIKLKNGSGAPLASDLVQGEPAFDLTNKRLYTENSSGTIIEIGTSPSTIDIDAGTIDGAVIGGSSAAAGTFTTITGSGDLAVDTDTLFADVSADRVGVNTASPAVDFHVAGETYIDSFLSLRTTDDQANRWALYTNTDDTFRMNYNGSGSDELVIDTSGNLGVGQSAPSAKLEVYGNAIARTNTDTSNTGSVTLDFATYQNHVLTLTGNVTLANPSTEVVGQSGFIVFIQDSTGSRTVSLGTDYETASGAGLTLSSTASATDIVPYVVAASGRILLGAPQLAFS